MHLTAERNVRAAARGGNESEHIASCRAPLLKCCALRGLFETADKRQAAGAALLEEQREEEEEGELKGGG